MILSFLKFYKQKAMPTGRQAESRKQNSGMTYVELIIVLSIFAVISSISIYSFKDFQARIDIRNLSNDIALRIISAQKLSLSGKLTNKTLLATPWRPSYGTYFNRNNGISDDDIGEYIFYSFVNLDNSVPDGYLFDKDYDHCPPTAISTAECLDKVTISRAKISLIEKCNTLSGICVPIPGELHISFTRPSAQAVITSTPAVLTGEYVRIKIESIENANIYSNISIYPLGRVQVN